MTAVNLNRAVRGPVTAVPVVAGKGVRIVPDVENNRFVVEADETVLWENENNTQNPTMSLSEALTNFEYIRIEYSTSFDYTVSEYSYNETTVLIPTRNIMTNKRMYITDMFPNSTSLNQLVIRMLIYTISNDAKTLTYDKGFQLYYSGSWSTGTTSMPIYKVVGVNRIASN